MTDGSPPAPPMAKKEQGAANAGRYLDVKEAMASAVSLAIAAIVLWMLYDTFTYAKESKSVQKYEDLYDTDVGGGKAKLKQSDREKSLH